MRNRDNDSYERYKKYRLNKYTYEQDQIALPVTIIIVIATIIALLKYILIALLFAGISLILFMLIRVYLRKQLTAQSIVITSADAKEGVSLHITVNYNLSKAIIDVDLPQNVKHGQKIKVKNVVFEKENGKRTRKNVTLTIEIKD